ncbi:unnamed protein product [Oppiella nova]|uniref:Uncharacterized protein n=1 Tax=Oppiella nova TaxID=334625 RepID=A0A7R9LLX8_9ACAR|nr:unnamed protein product [Oppiella nova]CAG2164951.1 unnamed protein product [Oppiella nova]
MRKVCINSTIGGRCNFINAPEISSVPDEIENYMTKDTGNDDAFSIEFDSTKLTETKITTFDSCGSDTLLCDVWSDCKPESGTSEYQCLCNQDYFTVVDRTILPTSGKTLYKEKCDIKDDICKECHSKSNTDCIQTIPVMDSAKQWTAPPNCSCLDHYKMDHDMKCIDVCDGIQCNQETYQSKKVKHRDNNSVQQMNDYSNTSYRVGQHNGNNNDGFNQNITPLLTGGVVVSLQYIPDHEGCYDTACKRYGIPDGEHCGREVIIFTSINRAITAFIVNFTKNTDNTAFDVQILTHGTDLLIGCPPVLLDLILE